MIRKLYLLSILFMVFSVNGYSVDRKFAKDFKVKISSANTHEAVEALSIMDDNLAFVRGGKVYSAEVVKGDLSKVRLMGDLNDLRIEGQFTMFANNTIYYSSRGVLYSATLKNGVWGSPEELVISGYSKRREMGKGSSFAYRRWQYKGLTREKEKMYNPILADNGKRIYFASSDIPGGKGGKDIWYIDKNADGHSWSKPKNFEAVNSSADEDFPFISGDSVIFFSTNRKCQMSGYNIFKKFLTSNNAPSPVLPLFNSNANDFNFVALNEDVFFLTNNTQAKSYIHYVKYQDSDLADDSEDRSSDGLIEYASSEPKVLEISGRKCTFYAEFDNAKLKKKYDEEFEQIYSFIKDSHSSSLEIVAHVDEDGTESHNYSISLRRASAIMDRLIEMGVKSRITYDGKGNSEPVIKNTHTEAERMRNRRIEIIIK